MGFDDTMMRRAVLGAGWEEGFAAGLGGLGKCTSGETDMEGC